MPQKWYSDCFRRTLVDMHIEEWNDEFLSKFDAQDYMKKIKDAHGQSAMLYANSHVGYTFYPTKTGHQNAALKGRDMMGEMVEECQKQGLHVVMYYSVIYNNWYYEAYPEDRMVDQNGNTSCDMPPKNDDRQTFFGRRYGLVCPNAPRYRQFVVDQMVELCEKYPFVGMFPDMTFWPMVCYCPHCQKRYAEEVGGEMPKIVDWNDPKWRQFQKKREEWLADFAHLFSDVLWKHNPGVAVYHQTSSITQPWERGMTMAVLDANDFAGGDFYEGFVEQSAVCKMCYNITANHPFEFMTSVSDPDLRNHTDRRPADTMKLHNFVAIAHNGSFMHIDAIDPVGTLNPRVYEKLGNMYAESMRYEPWLTGEMTQDVAVYFSMTANFDPDVTGPAVGGLGYSTKLPHLQAVLGAMSVITRAHIPCGLISLPNLGQLDRHQALILPEVVSLTQEEKDAIRSYVQGGGKVYASGRTDLQGLEDVFGLAFEGQLDDGLSYIRPATDGSAYLAEDVNATYPMQVNYRQVKAVPGTDTQVLAYITLPYSPVSSFDHFASIHSTPPGILTQMPALTLHAFGKGQAMWCSAPIESMHRAPQEETFVRLVRSFLQKPLTATADAPEVVEIIRFDTPEYTTVRLVNLQEKHPILPVYQVTAKVLLNGRKLKAAVLLPDESPVETRIEGDYVCVTLPRLDIFAMVRFDWV